MFPAQETVPYRILELNALSPGEHVADPANMSHQCVRHAQAQPPFPHYTFYTNNTNVSLEYGMLWFGSEKVSRTSSRGAAIKLFNVTSIPAALRRDDPRKEIATHSYLAQDAIWNEIEAAQNWRIPKYRNSFFCAEPEGNHEAAYITQHVNAPELFACIFTPSPISPFPAHPRRVFRSLLQAVKFLHSKNIYHLDISLENILYDAATDTVYIIDFGSSVYAQSHHRLPVAEYGKFHYRAPELHVHFAAATDTFSPEKADVWSLGMLFFFMLVRPSWYEREVSMQFYLLQQKCNTLQDLNDYLRDEYDILEENVRMILCRMLVRNENERFTMGAALDAVNALVALDEL